MTTGNRLDRMIARLVAQRDCLTLAIAMIGKLPGPVLEFGLGKGRTYDFLRARLADREIFVFDREIHCPPDCVPPAGRLFLGEFRETVPEARRALGDHCAALAHFDVASEDRARDAELIAWLAPAAAPLMRPGAAVVADRPMAAPGWRAVALPSGLGDGRHFVYRVESASGFTAS